MTSSILDIIARKRDGSELTSAEIHEIVEGITSASIPDYQIGALLMAIYVQGMTDRETGDMTMGMVHSGEVLDLSAINGFKVDKHSTGGVGDKVTPVLGPLVASAGIFFPKLSGRGLGHTGGTLDKLESIPGFRVDLSTEEFIRQVDTIGLAITGQTSELVPADGILYSLRDVTATVASVPLIASSVMSKKIAAGADGIVLDVKCGSGAFMRTIDEARELARLMVSIGRAAGKQTVAFITAMDEPLGRSIGNALEIGEAIRTLQGEEGDLLEECLALGSQILMMGGIATTATEGRELLGEKIRSGEALRKLGEMIRWQGGNSDVTNDIDLLPRAGRVIALSSSREGFVRRIDARQVGVVAVGLGAGRKVKGEPVDLAVGVILEAKVGDRVERGQTLAEVHTNGRIPDEEALHLLSQAFEVVAERPAPTPHVLEVITSPAESLR